MGSEISPCGRGNFAWRHIYHSVMSSRAKRRISAILTILAEIPRPDLQRVGTRNDPPATLPSPQSLPARNAAHNAAGGRASVAGGCFALWAGKSRNFEIPIHNFIASKFLIFLIRFYQLVFSPFFGPCCRFYPSCSSYFIEAVQQWGASKGTLLGIQRLGRCHPFHPGGFDPVPGKKPH